MKRVVPGAGALGLTLLAGCIIIPGDPPPVDPPPPLVDAGLPPVDAEPPPPVDAGPPPPPPVNIPSDQYDPGTHSVLVADCANNAIIGVNADTGERSVIIDQWPWAEPDSTTCADEIVVGRYGEFAMATVSRVFADPDDSDLTCVSTDLVLFGTFDQAVYHKGNLDLSCCDDCGDADDFYSVQVDLLRERLLFLESSCTPDHCDYFITGNPLDTTEWNREQQLYPVACYPDDEGCDYRYTSANLLRLDPVDPDHRVLVLAQPSTESFPYLDSIDLETGAIHETITIQSTWGDLELGYVNDIEIPRDSSLVLLTMAGGRSNSGDTVWAVVAIHRFTGTQTLVYDGSPTVDGKTLSCTPETSFDTLNGRLLLVEPPGGYGCEDNAFSLDITTGELSTL